LVVVIQNIENKLLADNLLHHKSHKFGFRNSAHSCRFLKILRLQRNQDIFDRQMTPPPDVLVTSVLDQRVWRELASIVAYRARVWGHTVAID
jgi:hypothetical protein